MYFELLSAVLYRVITVADGIEVIKKLREIRPDLILLDVMMPRLNGISACREIRGAIGPHVPIIFLSAVNEVETVRRALEVGGDDYVVKSGNMDAVLTRVKFWTQPISLEARQKRRKAALASLAT
mgnify:CR=1 FL=1